MSTEKHLTENQSKFFQPCRALPWKDWILAKHASGISKTQIHNQLLLHFPEASDVSIGSVNTILKSVSKHPKKKKIHGQIKQAVIKCMKEIQNQGKQPKSKDVFKMITAQGIETSEQYVYLVLRNTPEFTLGTLGNKEDEVHNIVQSLGGIGNLKTLKNIVDEYNGIENIQKAMEIIKKLKSVEM